MKTGLEQVKTDTLLTKYNDLYSDLMNETEERVFSMITELLELENELTRRGEIQ